MDSKMRTLVIAIIAAIILWFGGGFIFGKAVGMICVIAGIAIVALAAGNVMDSPEPPHK